MKTLEEIETAARELAANGPASSQSGQWSLATTCDHLAKTMDHCWSGASLGPRRVPRLLQPVIRNLFLLTGYLPPGQPIPNTMEPGEGLDTVDTADAVERLALAVRNFRDLPPERRARMAGHPALGTMTYESWRKLHLIHAAFHFRIYSGKKY